jgi:hypothetical protein
VLLSTITVFDEGLDCHSCSIQPIHATKPRILRRQRTGRLPAQFSQVNGGGQECPPHTLQYRSECSDYVAGFQWGFRAEPSLYLVAEILALADHVDGSSGGAVDWPDAAFFSLV